ncbi:rCG31060, partial [Rattus norvegicus]
MSRWRT